MRFSLKMIFNEPGIRLALRDVNYVYPLAITHLREFKLFALSSLINVIKTNNNHPMSCQMVGHK